MLLLVHIPIVISSNYPLKAENFSHFYITIQRQ